MSFQTIIDEVNKRNQPNKTFLIAIDGRSGSGKTVLAEKLKNNLKGATVVHLDTFDLYKGESSVQEVISEVLEPLKNNTKQKKSLIIIEGVFALSPGLEKYYNYKIWMNCPAEVGYKRGLERDINLNGIDNSDKWTNYWLPKEEDYIKKYKPQDKADYVFDVVNAE